MAVLKRWDGAAWQPVPNGDDLKYWDGAAWQIPTALRYWDGAAWQNGWLKSNPRTYFFEATDTESWRSSGWRVSGDHVYTGSWDNGDHIGVMVFNTDTVYGETMAQAMSTRPTIVGTPKLRLKRENSVHGYGGEPGGYSDTIYLGSYTGTIRSGDADLSVDITPTSTYTSYVLRGETIEINMDNQLITDMQGGRELWVANQTSAWSATGGQDHSYFKFEGAEVGLVPRVEVTLDY